MVTNLKPPQAFLQPTSRKWSRLKGRERQLQTQRPRGESKTRETPSLDMAQRADYAETLLSIRDRGCVEMSDCGHGEGYSQRTERCPVLTEIFARNRGGQQQQFASSPCYGGMTVEQTYQQLMEEGLGALQRLGSGHTKLSDPSYDRGLQASLTTERFVARSRAKIEECCRRTQQDLFSLRHAGKVGPVRVDIVERQIVVLDLVQEGPSVPLSRALSRGYT